MDRKPPRPIVFWTIVFFTLLVPLSADAPMADANAQCEFACAGGWSLSMGEGGGWHCNNSGSDCERCWLICY